MSKVIQDEERGHSDEDDQRHLHSGLAVDLGDEVGGGDVDGYSGGHRQSVAHGMLADGHSENAGNRRQPSITEANHERCLLNPLASITEVTVKPSGILCRKTARKMIQPNHGEIRKPAVMAMPSKKVWIINPNRTDTRRWECTYSSEWVSSP